MTQQDAQKTIYLSSPTIYFIFNNNDQDNGKSRSKSIRTIESFINIFDQSTSSISFDRPTFQIDIKSFENFFNRFQTINNTSFSTCKIIRLFRPFFSFVIQIEHRLVSFVWMKVQLLHWLNINRIGQSNLRLWLHIHKVISNPWRDFQSIRSSLMLEKLLDQD